MEVKWWEKTIEYSFVCNFQKNFTFLSPLDGNHEKAGDAILSVGEKFLLIEFKKEFKNIKDEKHKFDEKKLNELAQKKEINGPHLIDINFHKIIYGEKENDKLLLKEINYWKGLLNDNEVTNKGNEVNEKIFTNGTNKESFDEYLSYFLELKNYKSQEKDSSAFSSYEYVLGIEVDKEGKCKVVSMQHINDYIKNNDNFNFLKKQNVTQQNNKISKKTNNLNFKP